MEENDQDAASSKLASQCPKITFGGRVGVERKIIYKKELLLKHLQRTFNPVKLISFKKFDERSWTCFEETWYETIL